MTRILTKIKHWLSMFFGPRCPECGGLLSIDDDDGVIDERCSSCGYVSIWIRRP